MIIKLNKLSEEQFDKIYYDRIGLHSGDYYEIELNDLTGDNTIGLIMVSNANIVN